MFRTCASRVHRHEAPLYGAVVRWWCWLLPCGPTGGRNATDWQRWQRVWMRRSRCAMWGLLHFAPLIQCCLRQSFGEDGAFVKLHTRSPKDAIVNVSNTKIKVGWG